MLNQYEQTLQTMQQARDRCDETIREMQADIARESTSLDATLYAALETGQADPATMQQLQPYLQGTKSPWEAAAIAYAEGRLNTENFRDRKTLARRVLATLEAIHQRTLLGTKTRIEETDDAKQIAKRTGMPISPARFVRAAYDGITKRGIRLTITADGNPIIRPTPAKILLYRQDDKYVAQEFFDKYCKTADPAHYQEILTAEVQDMLLLGLFPQFFKEEILDKRQEELEEIVHNPLVSQAMPKIYAMAKELSAATKTRPTIWQKIKRTLS